MLCQICLQAEATVHVLDRLWTDPLAESHYCPACYGHALVNPPTGWSANSDDPSRPSDPPSLIPRLRFTIRHLMILAGLFGLLNATVVLFLRYSPDPGTPAEIGRRTRKAILFANVFCPFLAAEALASRWLKRQRWYRMTGRWVPLEHLPAEKRLLAAHGAPTGWRSASRGEWAFIALNVLWGLLWIYWLRTASMRSWLPEYDVEVAFSYLLILSGGSVLLALGAVASPRRRVGDARFGPGPVDRPLPDFLRAPDS